LEGLWANLNLKHSVTFWVLHQDICAPAVSFVFRDRLELEVAARPNNLQFSQLMHFRFGLFTSDVYLMNEVLGTGWADAHVGPAITAWHSQLDHFGAKPLL
jgi:hypothetical protein